MDESVTLIVAIIPSAAVVASTWMFCRTIRRMNWAVVAQGDTQDAAGGASEAELATHSDADYESLPAPVGQHTYEDVDQLFG